MNGSGIILLPPPIPGGRGVEYSYRGPSLALFPVENVGGWIGVPTRIFPGLEYW